MNQNSKTQMITEELVPSQEFANMIKESAETLSPPVSAEDFIKWLEAMDPVMDQMIKEGKTAEQIEQALRESRQ